MLHSISTSAARYGRYIQPLVSLSIDFYVRVFVRVKSSAFEVKKAATSVSFVYHLTYPLTTTFAFDMAEIRPPTTSAPAVNHIMSSR